MKRATTWLLSITIALCAAGATSVGTSIRCWTSPTSISRTIEKRENHASNLQAREPKQPRQTTATHLWHNQQFQKSQLTKVLYQRPPPPILL